MDVSVWTLVCLKAVVLCLVRSGSHLSVFNQNVSLSIFNQLDLIMRPIDDLGVSPV